VRNKEAKNLHQIFVETIREALTEISGNPIIDYDQKLIHFLHDHLNLSVREDSPIFRYSLNELNNADTFPLCAIRKALQWIHHTQEVLILIHSGRLYPIPAVVKNYYNHECPGAQNIPVIEGLVMTIPREKLQDNKFFWIPRDYLP
jgi:hypothetical protein